jgi:uncharacterized membrane protein
MITVSFGLVKNILNLCRGEKVDLKAFINVKPITILNYIIVSLITSVAISIGLLLFVIPGIILTLIFVFAPILVIDRNMGPIEAIKESVKLTANYKMDILVGLFIGFVLFLILSSFIVTLVYTLPMLLFIWVYPYLKLTGQLGNVNQVGG